MIHRQTLLRVIDNSGGATIKAFNVLRKGPRPVGRIGDVIVGSIQTTRDLEETKANSKVQRVTKGQVVHAVIVRTHKESRREDGALVGWDDNACVLVDVDKKKGVIPKGTRITGVVAQELRRRQMTKILALAPLVV
jgi:ribosomal protein L14